MNDRRRCTWALSTAMTLLIAILGNGLGETRAIPCLSGFVRDSGGTPVVGADLDFFNSVTGDKLITPGDNTDVSGFYSVCILPGIYDVTFAPPRGTRLMGKVIPGLDLRADPGIALDVVLDNGTVIDGIATALSDGQPVADVDIDVDEVGGGRIFTPEDNTDATGAYRLVIPNGLFRVRYEPPPGTRLRGVQLDSVQVQNDTTIDVAFPEGVLLSGRVSDGSSSGIPGVDIDLRDWATSQKIFVANNTTDIDGRYAVAVPTGTVALRFSPARGAPQVATVHDSFVITEDLVIEQALQTGHVLTVKVLDPDGSAVPGADLDVKIASTGDKIFTPHDVTIADGTAIAALVSDTYRLQIDPPPGASLDRMVLENVVVAADTTITVTLPEAHRVTVTGRVVDESAIGIEGAELEARLRATDTKVFIPDPFTDVSGSFSLSIPVGSYDLFVVPQRGSSHIADILEEVEVISDADLGVIVLADGILARIQVLGAAGVGVVGADIDVIQESSQKKVFTPHDNTGANGLAEAALDPDRYTFRVTPPSGSPYDLASVAGVVVSQDTLLTITLLVDSGNLPAGSRMDPSYPNPFHAQLTLPYTIAQPSDVSISVYNVAGQLTRELVRSFHPADVFVTTWDGLDGGGSLVASGLYIVKLVTNTGQDSRKVILVR